MNQVYKDSVAKAKSYYANNTDAIHDLTHSERVAENAKQIAKSLGYEDFDFLELCAYWHDVARTLHKEPHEEVGAVMAKEDLLSRGAGENEANKAYEGIRFHKSTASPITIEGKIIRDADKLDIYSIVRWENARHSGWNETYAEDLRKTLDKVHNYPNTFTYDYTKQEYEKILPSFLKLAQNLQDT